MRYTPFNGNTCKYHSFVEILEISLLFCEITVMTTQLAVTVGIGSHDPWVPWLKYKQWQEPHGSTLMRNIAWNGSVHLQRSDSRNTNDNLSLADTAAAPAPRRFHHPRVERRLCRFCTLAFQSQWTEAEPSRPFFGQDMSWQGHTERASDGWKGL